jgi:hypothetical protein
MEVAMRVHLVAILVLPALLGGSLSARSDRFPKLNVARFAMELPINRLCNWDFKP